MLELREDLFLGGSVGVEDRAFCAVADELLGFCLENLDEFLVVFLELDGAFCEGVNLVVELDEDVGVAFDFLVEDLEEGLDEVRGVSDERDELLSAEVVLVCFGLRLEGAGNSFLLDAEAVETQLFSVDRDLLGHAVAW